jgi:hypothetical protein
MSREAEIRWLAEKVTGWRVIDRSDSVIGQWLDLIIKGRAQRFWCPGSAVDPARWDPFTSEADCAAMVRALLKVSTPDKAYNAAHEYIYALNVLVVEELIPTTAEDMFAVATASCEDRCAAALRATGYVESPAKEAE